MLAAADRDGSRFGWRAWLALGAGAAWFGAAHAACPPEGRDKAALVALAGSGFEVADDAERKQLALGLLDCLADPDPVLRDEVAFEAWSAWLRGKKLDEAARRAALDTLLPRLSAPDPRGFAAPFAALTLAEVARTDRIEPWLDGKQRAALVEAAAEYLSGVRDYRGFDERDGWRHGVAHGSDFALQLALNPALDRPALDRLLAAVASQVVPRGGHFYIYGEPERLAAPVLYIGKRALHDAEDWRKWFAALADPKPLASWRDAFKSQAGLAKRHDTQAFLLALYANLREGGDAALAERMLPGVVEALKAVP